MKKIGNLRQRPFVYEAEKAIRGYLMCKKIRRKYGKDAHIIITRGKIGDIYLYFRFLKTYLEKNGIENYVMVGDCKNITSIQKLYPNIKGPCIPTSEYMGGCLQNAYCLWGSEKLNCTLSLMWDVDLPFNRCATRLTDRFNFIDSYYWFLFDLDREKTEPTQAHFEQLSPERIQQLETAGFQKGKTVVISPFAYCVRCLPHLFWELLGKDLQNRGYTVLFMVDPVHEKNEFGFPRVFFKYAESVPVLEYAGHFIGLRSGFCDIISSAVCQKVILYPTKPKLFDGGAYRADVMFSGLKEMELSEDAAEIVVPFARNIGDFEPEEENLTLRFAEEYRLIEQILRNFPDLKRS